MLSSSSSSSLTSHSGQPQHGYELKPVQHHASTNNQIAGASVVSDFEPTVKKRVDDAASAAAAAAAESDLATKRPPSIKKAPPAGSSSIVESHLHAIYQLLQSHSARLILTQTEDLLDESSFLESSFFNPTVSVTRVGVFEEDFAPVLAALDQLMQRHLAGISRKDVKIVDPRKWADDKSMKVDKDGEMMRCL